MSSGTCWKAVKSGKSCLNDQVFRFNASL